LIEHALFFGQALPSSARRNWSRWLSSCHVSIVTIASIVMRPRVGCRQPRCRCSGVRLRSSASESSRRLRNAASAWTASFPQVLPVLGDPVADLKVHREDTTLGRRPLPGPSSRDAA
jgi:hypothetical protein